MKQKHSLLFLMNSHTFPSAVFKKQGAQARALPTKWAHMSDSFTFMFNLNILFFFKKMRAIQDNGAK